MTHCRTPPKYNRKIDKRWHTVGRPPKYNRTLDKRWHTVGTPPKYNRQIDKNDTLSLYCGGVPTVCHSWRFVYYIVELYRQCAILVDFSIILWRWHTVGTPPQYNRKIDKRWHTVGTPAQYNRKIDKNDTLSEHLHNIIEKSTRMTHCRNVSFLSIFLLYCGAVPTVCLLLSIFYYILEVFRQCVILVDFSIILWRCSDSVSFLSIFWHIVGTPPKYNRKIDQNDKL
jgi:hypothetical protein